MYNIYDTGRWYRFFIESDGTGHKLTQSDIKDAEISGNYLILPKDMHIIDRKYDFSFTGVATVAEVIKTYADGRESVALPAKNTFDYGYVYVFAHEKGVK